jgi:Tfp pilus assembly protein PilP
MRRWLGHRVTHFVVPATLAGTLGWAWPVVPAHQALRQAQDHHDHWVQAHRRWLLHGPTETTQQAPVLAGAPSDTASEAESAHPSVADDDISALVRWQALLTEHRLSGWHGRSLPPSAARSGSASDNELVAGGVWQLEGAATHAQGLALLQGLIRTFPQVLLLAVEVNHLPAEESLLQWKLELRWRGWQTGLAASWPARPEGLVRLLGDADPKRLPHPFARQNLALVWRDPDATGYDLQAGADIASDGWAEARPSNARHVLPRVSVRQLRHAGVVAADGQVQALVAIDRSGDAGAGTAARETAGLHRLVAGEWVGLERARLLSIHPQRLTLRIRAREADGRWAEREHLLMVADGGLRP